MQFTVQAVNKITYSGEGKFAGRKNTLLTAVCVERNVGADKIDQNIKHSREIFADALKALALHQPTAPSSERPSNLVR